MVRFVNFTRRIALVAVSAVVAGTLVSGCSSSPSSTPGVQSDSAQSDSGGSEYVGPEFEGAFAEELRYAYQEASTDLGRLILEDGKVTDAEFAEVEAILTACLLEKGIRVEGGLVGDGGGGLSYEAQLLRDISEEEDKEIEIVCEEKSDAYTVGLLYFSMKENPENRSQAEVMAECLVHKQAVPEGYSGEDWERHMLQEQAEPANMSAEELKLFEAEQECFADPFDR